MSDLKGIAAKLILISKDIPYVQKDAQNEKQKYRYVSAAHILGKVNESLTTHNCCSVPEFVVTDSKETKTSSGAIWQLVTVKCSLQIIDANTGESVIVTSLGSGTDPGDKAVAKAQTMAIKYAWLTALNIETGNDPEADPRTDNTEFTGQPQGQQSGPGQQMDALQILINQRMQVLSQLWQQIGWDIRGIAVYLEERFKKPFAQITTPELDAMITEAQGYLQQKTLSY